VTTTGSPRLPRAAPPRPPGRRGRRRTRLPQSVRIALLLAPALVVVATFFVGGAAQGVAQSLGYQPYLPGSRISTDPYLALWRDPAVRASLLLTAWVSFVSTALASLLGVAGALLIRGLGRSRSWVAAVFQANLAVPHLVGALCMLLLLSQAGFLSRVSHGIGVTSSPSGFLALINDEFGWGIIAEYVWKETPFLTVIALASLTGGVRDLENAARSLGANGWQRLVNVTLPVIAPAMAAGSVLVFAFAAGSYEVPFLLGRPFPATLPVVALQYASASDLTARPAAMAVTVLITVTSGLVVAAYLALLSRLSRRHL